MYVCRKADPESKGKIENVIKFVKYNFLASRDFDALDEANLSLAKWLTRRANGKISQATKRIPAEMFEEERDLLIDHTGKPPYVLQVQVIRSVAKDCMINFETNRYSVPFPYVGKQVEVQTEPDLIRIYHDGQLIAVHSRSLEKHQIRMERVHYDGIFSRRKLSGKITCSEISSDEVEVRDLGFYERLVEGGAV